SGRADDLLSVACPELPGAKLGFALRSGAGAGISEGGLLATADDVLHDDGGSAGPRNRAAAPGANPGGPAGGGAVDRADPAGKTEHFGHHHAGIDFVEAEHVEQLLSAV